MDDALKDPSAKIIGSRWVVCNKNDVHDPDVRARLVAQEVNVHGDASFFAATPPLESKRMLLSQFATERTRHGKPLKLSFIDVRKAYFYGRPSRNLYIRPPQELGLPKHVVCKRVRCMYGTRDAGAIWEDVYSDTLLAMGFVQGKASPCCFWYPGWELSCVVHGDDFTCLGVASSLDKYERAMQDAFDCKMKGRLGTENMMRNRCVC